MVTFTMFTWEVECGVGGGGRRGEEGGGSVGW